MNKITLISCNIISETTSSPIIDLIIHQDDFYRLSKKISRESIQDLIADDSFIDNIIDDMISTKVKMTQEEIDIMYSKAFDDTLPAGFEKKARALLISLNRDNLIDEIIKNKE